LSIFSKIDDSIDIDPLEKIAAVNQKVPLFHYKRKETIFNRYRKEQEEKFVHQKAEVEKKFLGRDGSIKISKTEFTLRNEALNKI
jgi:hypothetical protein